MPILTRTRYVKVKEFCDYWKISKTQVYRFMKMEGFPYKRVGECIRIAFDEANSWIDKNYN